MQRKFVGRSKSDFESLLKAARSGYSFGLPKDITWEARRHNLDIWEYVYELALFGRGRKVRVIVYSSVDRHSDRFRDRGEDMVRLVLEWTWKTDGSRHYKRLRHLQRIGTLDANLRAALVEVAAMVGSMRAGDGWEAEADYRW